MGTIFLLYGAGFVVLFLMFALLYLNAYRRREALGLTALEVFDLRMAGGAHLVSASVGVLSCAVVFLPRPWPVFAGFVYFLMGPAHWLYGTTMGRRRAVVALQTDGPAPR